MLESACQSSLVFSPGITLRVWPRSEFGESPLWTGLLYEWKLEGRTLGPPFCLALLEIPVPRGTLSISYSYLITPAGYSVPPYPSLIMLEV